LVLYWKSSAVSGLIIGRVMGRFVGAIYISAVKRVQWSLGNPEAGSPDPRVGRTILGQL
jgi:hypothetical protein